MEEKTPCVNEELSAQENARRDFLRSAGKFAAATPAAMTFLLGTSLGSKAIAASSGVQPRMTRPGFGRGDKNHVHTGPRKGGR